MLAGLSVFPFQKCFFRFDETDGFDEADAFDEIDEFESLYEEFVRNGKVFIVPALRLSVNSCRWSEKIKNAQP